MLPQMLQRNLQANTVPPWVGHVAKVLFGYMLPVLRSSAAAASTSLGSTPTGQAWAMSCTLQHLWLQRCALREAHVLT